MTIQKIPASLKRWSAMIDEIEDYREQGPGGDGYWVHLVPGLICTTTEIHSVHEDNITQCADVFKTGAIKPCNCVECQKLIARKADLAVVRKIGRPKSSNPASVADRLLKSRSALSEAGGQRLEIRLSSSASDDLKIVMALRKLSTKKAAIEWCLMACRTAVVHTDTKTKSTT